MTFSPSAIIDKNSPIPIYHQVFIHIRNRILCFEWAEGSKLPTENELADIYGVSRVSIRQALDTLESEGLIKRIRGSGAYVQKLPQPLIHDFSLPSTLCAKLGQHGISLDATMLELSVLPMVPHINSILKLKYDQQLVHMKRLFLYDKQAIAINESWISHELIPDMAEKGLIDNHLSITLARRYSLSPISIQNTIEAGRLNITELEQLNVAYETPIITVSSISFLPHDVPLEYSRTLWRGDRVKFTYNLDSH